MREMLSTGEYSFSSIGQQDGKKNTIDFVVKKLCQHIRSNLTSDEWRKFEEEKTDRGRLELFVDNEEIQSCVKKYLQLHPAHKDKAKAIVLKNSGNKAFGSGDNEKALYFYTKCLAWMPHDETKDAAIVYANRSAALFHLNEFSLAEKDAELAFKFNYPTELSYKLFERLGRCCLQLGKTTLAVNHLQRGIKALQMSGLDEAKIVKTKKSFEELIKGSPNSSQGSFSNQDKSSSKIAGSQQFQFPALPEVVGGRSKYLRSTSKRLTLRSTEKQGRFAVATESFRPGDVILVEKAYVSVLLPEHYHRQCFQCYAPLRAPVPCKTCIFASFCSIECRDKAWKTHHKYECELLGLLSHSGISVICYMALRILTQSDPKEVLRSGWYEIAKKTEQEEISKSSVPTEEIDSFGNKTTKVTQTSLGFNEYVTDHTALFQLVTHKNVRCAEELLHHTVMAVYILNALRSTTYFEDAKFNVNGNGAAPGGGKGVETSGPTGEQRSKNISAKKEQGSQNELRKTTSILQTEMGKSEYKDEDVPLDVKFGVLLLRFLQFLPFNAHETSAWDPDAEKDNSIGLGAGLFPTLALFNHSCNPAIVRYFINDTVVVRAIKTILPGETVTENYGQVFSVTPKKERQSKLLSHFWFECECIACKEDWPTFETMPTSQMSFKCEHCGAFICKADENMGILFSCGKCKKSVNILKSLKSISESDAKYSQALKFIDSGEIETGLEILLQNLSMLDKFLLAPFKDYHLCQEMCRKCLLNFGNRTSHLPAWDPETGTAE